MKPLDVLVIVLCAAVTVLVSLAVYKRGSESLMVVIKSHDKTWIFPLEAEEELFVPGTIGETVVHIHSGRAAIVSSPCSGQTCVAAGELERSGQWVACLPNRVFLHVESAKGNDAVDAEVW